MSRKVDSEFVRRSFSTKEKISYYVDATETVGLWQSERIVFQKHLAKDGRILDIGCGTGRVSIGLYQLGYHEIEGIDFSEAMIQSARKFATRNSYPIRFRVGDAMALDYKDGLLAGVIVAFNGLMQIPLKQNRTRALFEVKRVLKPGGSFIFTTHDRDMAQSDERRQFWETERDQWDKGTQDPRKREFGDLFFSLEGVESFIHVPDREEVVSTLNEAGLDLTEDLWRTEICEEAASVKEFSSECRFWVVRKPKALLPG